ncbi:ABC transporter substrate-binding protein [Gaiella sp.]|jgi:peptide/nickel transport system substrate-binding protein|uniref:ABC transporter substrate-binding protein n=1 Tax=Gaiella sp. TaxID=2663207 RepID=UPI002BAD281A|nr:ABC transporter substrate-binding protein [Gaiella sp.]HWO81610.1 ABC transporter substrate-binding protein [Gaiella sp.]
MRRHRFAALSVVAAALLAAGALSAASAADRTRASATAAAGSITLAIGSEPTTLDPQLKDDGGERAVTRNIYETLMARTRTGKLVPGLAAAAPKQIRPKVWRVVLRTGITFTNGEPLNADAVVYSIKRIINKKFNSEQVSFVGTISGAKKVNARTVDITTTAPDPILPSRIYWLTIVPPKAAQAAGFAEKPVGTGPYTFVEWRKGDHITLKANPRYWGTPKPRIQTVTYKFVPEGGTRLAGLLAGDFDLITNLLPEDVKRAPKAVSAVGLEHPVVILNAKQGSQVTSDPRVRQALNLAVDKNGIAKALFGGFARVDDAQFLSPSWTGYNPTLRPFAYDVNRAKQLIDAAGASGKTINFVGESGRWLKDKETIEAVASFWRAIGLKVNVQIFDFGEYLNRLFDKANRPDAIYLTSSNELLDADRSLSAYYAPSGIGASNDDQALEKWITQARSEANTKKRDALYRQATKRARDQAYFTFLVNIADLYGTSKRLVWQPRQDSLLFLNTMALGGA